MKLPRAASLSAALVLLVAAPGPAQEEPPRPLRPLVLQRGSVAEERADEVRAALASIVQYVSAQYGELLRSSAYQTLYYEGPLPVYHFGELAQGARLEDVFVAFRRDPEWQRRSRAYFASIDEDLFNEILIPVTGRASDPGRVRIWRSARAAYGHLGPALRVARQLTEHLCSAHPGVGMRLYVQETEELGILHWIADYEDLDAWAEVRGSLTADETYLALLDELAAHLVEGSVQTQMLDRLRY